MTPNKQEEEIKLPEWWDGCCDDVLTAADMFQPSMERNMLKAKILSRMAMVGGVVVRELAKATQEERDRIAGEVENVKPTTQPLEPYLSIVKTGNMDAMFDWAYQQAQKDILSLLKTNPS